MSLTARNTVLIVGWQAPHTTGRRIAEKREVIRIFGDEYPLRANVATINGFSAHADRSELLDWTARFKRRPKHTFIVHGEEEASLDFAGALRGNGFEYVHVPELHQKFEI